MAKITFAKKNRPSFEVAAGEVLMQALLAHQVPVASSCKGDGICGKCRMIIVSGSENISPISELEKILIEKNKFPKGTRISCQVHITGAPDSEIEVDTGYW